MAISKPNIFIGVEKVIVIVLSVVPDAVKFESVNGGKTPDPLSIDGSNGLVGLENVTPEN